MLGGKIDGEQQSKGVVIPFGRRTHRCHGPVALALVLDVNLETSAVSPVFRVQTIATPPTESVPQFALGEVQSGIKCGVTGT